MTQEQAMTVKTPRGSKYVKAEIFAEGDFWRWRLTDGSGVEYLDGGNYHSEQQARDGLASALAE